VKEVTGAARNAGRRSDLGRPHNMASPIFRQGPLPDSLARAANSIMSRPSQERARLLLRVSIGGRRL